MGAIDRLKKSCEKEITLAQSGARVSFRKLIAFDLSLIGDVPDTTAFMETENVAKLDKKAIDYYLAGVCEAVYAIDGEPVICTIKKPPIKEEGILSVYSFGEDLGQLIGEIFSFIRGGDGKNPARFQDVPKEQKANDPAGQNSTEIRETS
jgi:hypothetical protein